MKAFQNKEVLGRAFCKASLQYKVVLGRVCARLIKESISEMYIVQALQYKEVLGRVLCKLCSPKKHWYFGMQNSTGTWFVRALQCKVVLGRALCEID